jgi:hypothetical protein
MDGECRRNAACYERERADRINRLLKTVKALYAEILQTPPSSPLGASILIRIAAGRLPFAHARYGDHLHRIADRLEEGQRLHSDLVWLRAVAQGLGGGSAKDAMLAPLLERAASGVARPVVVYRAVLPPARRPPDWHKLAMGPG